MLELRTIALQKQKLRYIKILNPYSEDSVFVIILLYFVVKLDDKCKCWDRSDL